MKKQARGGDFFYPICGLDNSSPLCYFLRFEGFNILLDCGITEDEEVQEKLRSISKTLDVILLSHSSHNHVGGLPFLMVDCECHASVYATLPTMRMGEMTLYDHVYNRSRLADIDEKAELTRIDDSFSSVNELKYTESFVINNEEKNRVIIVQPFNSGHSLGGVAWRITNEIDTVIYCVDYDIRKSNYLNGLDLRVFENKPTLMIMDSKYAEDEKSPKDQEASIKSSILKILQGGGNVLIPTDTSGRCLELISMLEKMWDSTPELQQISELYFVSKMSKSVNNYAVQLLQFMSSDVIDEFNETRTNPFTLKHCKLIRNLEDLNEMSLNTVLASTSDLENGFARDIFLRWVQHSRNGIVMVDRSPPGTLGRKMCDFVMNKNKPQSIRLMVTTKEPLSGERRKKYIQEKIAERERELKRQQEEEVRKRVVEIRDVEDEDDDDDQMSDDESDGEDDFEDTKDKKKRKGRRSRSRMGLSSTTASGNPNLHLPENMRYASKFLMFPPIVEHGFEHDDYGEFIDPGDLKKMSIQMLQRDTEISILRNRAGLIMESEELDNIQKKRRGKSFMKGGDDRDDYEDKDTGLEFSIPTEIVSSRATIMLKAQLFYVSVSGRVTSDHAQQLLQEVNPRHLVLVGSNGGEDMVEFCRKNGVCKSVYVAVKRFGRVGISTEHVAFRVKLGGFDFGSGLVAVLKEYRMGYFEGKYKYERVKEEKDVKKEEDEEDEMEDEKKTLNVTVERTKEDLGHAPLFLGNIKLNEFRESLNRKGITTQFLVGGGVICNNSILLTKDPNNGKIRINGPICSDYFKIREVLYDQFTIL